MTQPTVRANSGNEFNAATGTITYPAGILGGDYLVFYVVRSANEAVPTAPAGWTLLNPAGAAIQGTSLTAYWWGRYATGTFGAASPLAGTTFTYTPTANGRSVWTMTAYSDVDQTTALDVAMLATGFVTGSASNNHVMPSANAVTSDSLITEFVANKAATIEADHVAPTGVTRDRQQKSASTSSPYIAVGHVDAAATADGNANDGGHTWTSTQSSQYIVATLVLRAAVPAVTSVSSTRSTSWNTRAGVSASTRATTWNTLASVTPSTRATTWNLAAAVTASRATTWNVAGALTTVSTTRATTWNVIGSITSTRATTWHTRSVVAASTRATTWHTRSAVSASTRATTWHTRAAATSTRATTWNVAALAPPGTVNQMWVGGATAGGFVVTSRLTGATSVRLAISTSPSMTSPSYVAAQTPDGSGRVRHVATGLSADTLYYCQLADTPTGGGESLVGSVGQIKTMQTAGTPFSGTRKVLIGGCIRTNSTDSTALTNALAWGPDWGHFNGDFHYGSSTSTTVSVQAAQWDTQIAAVPDLKEFIRKGLAAYYNTSDHEAGPDNGDSNNAYTQANIDAYQQVVPYGTLLDTGGTKSARDQKWQDGRVAYYMTDCRNHDRSPGANTDNSSKTMLGAAQLARLLAWIASPPGWFNVMITDVALLGAADTVAKPDAWWSYTTERQQIIDAMVASKAANPGVHFEIWHGDSHLIGYATATKNAGATYGGIPVLCAAPYDQDGGGRNTSTFSAFFNNASADPAQEYGRVTFTDDGTTITRVFSGWDAITNTQKLTDTVTVTTLTSVTSTRSTTWNTRAAASSTRATTWNTRGVVAASTRATTWNALASATSTRATTWHTRAAATATRATSWNVAAAAASTRATTWNVCAIVAASRATTWHVRGVVASTRSTTWNVAGTLTTVSATRSTTWHVRAGVASTRSTTWHVRVTVTGTRATTWTVLAAVSPALRSTTWRTLAVVAPSTRSTTWHTRSSCISEQVASWMTYALVASLRSTRWNVAAPTTPADHDITATGTLARPWRGSLRRADRDGELARPWKGTLTL